MLYMLFISIYKLKRKYSTTPITIIFGARLLLHTIAKDIIHLILCLQQLIDNDEEVSKYLKVVMMKTIMLQQQRN